VFIGPFLSSFLDAAFVVWNHWGQDGYWELIRIRVIFKCRLSVNHRTVDHNMGHAWRSPAENSITSALLRGLRRLSRLVGSQVESHGGTITAENADGGGTRFEFVLPVNGMSFT
jgi:hypothetical protein